MRVVPHPRGVFDVGMHVIVVGCGRVGSGLAVALAAGGHSVVMVDKRAEAFRRLPDEWPGERMIGFGFDRDLLDTAGATRASALAAVTSGDNSNILTARIARETYEIPAVVARIYDPRRAEIYQRLGIPTVATVTWTTNQVLRRLLPEQSATEWSDAADRVRLVEHLLPATWGGRQLSDVERPGEIRLVSVTRAGVAQLPTPELLGQEGDVLHLAVVVPALDRLDQVLAGLDERTRG
jgi:trk system potassium uptake protein TrkA